jgi:anti-anti-sigma factor
MFDIMIDGEKARLILSGDVDLQTTADLKQDIAALNGITHLEVQAGQVSYIDSSGVAVLLYARQLCGQRNVGFAITVVSQALFRVLELAHLHTILPIGQVVDGPDMPVDEAAFLAVPSSDDGGLYDLISFDAEPEPPLDLANPNGPTGAGSADHGIAADDKHGNDAPNNPVPNDPVSDNFSLHNLGIDGDECADPAGTDAAIKPGDFG